MSPSQDLAQALDRLRAGGAAQRHPVRWRRIEALQRRAAAHDGATRQWLDQRLWQLLDGCGESEAMTAPAPPAAAPSPLATLLAALGQQAGDTSTQPAAPPELKAVREHRGTWARLALQQRLARAQALVPANAGPLNTQRLLHEALATLQQVAPAYLQQLVTQVEALLWLERASQGPLTGATHRGR